MSFPQMAEVFWDWTDNVTLKLIKKGITDFEVTESEIVETTFQGVLQPMPPQKLLVKPEGQRLWKFWELWTTQFLEPDQIIQDPDGTIYRVMSKDNWNNAGYYHYELTQGVAGE